MEVSDLEHRVKALEEDMVDLKADIKQIMRNHLPHISNEISKLETSMKIYGGLIIAGITALIILGLTP